MLMCNCMLLPCTNHHHTCLKRESQYGRQAQLQSAHTGNSSHGMAVCQKKSPQQRGLAACPSQTCHPEPAVTCLVTCDLASVKATCRETGCLRRQHRGLHVCTKNAAAHPTISKSHSRWPACQCGAHHVFVTNSQLATLK